jgi:putative hydrolase of HD superfamily
MIDYERFERQLAFLREIDKVKSVYRNTILMDASRRENDAEHSWHMAVCAMLFLEYADDKSIDMLKVLKMIMLHDTVEIYAGDTFAYDAEAKETQKDRETAAAEKLFGLLPPDQNEEFKALWLEFEDHKTAEAKYARLVDTFMPIYHNYVTQGQKWRELGVTKEKVLARNEPRIRDASADIWDYIQSSVADAADKGYLPDPK